MKRVLLILCAGLLLTACSSSDKQLKKRAAELCRYVPDHELLERSKDYMTEDFYAVLDTMFYRLPEHEAMDHEWLYYFVTGNGGTIADYEVQSVEKTDDTHAVATILVRQVWPEGTVGEEAEEAEVHYLYMERVEDQWLMSDFDGHKADCIRYIENNRKEQAVRKAVCQYLETIAAQYAQGDLFVPTLMMVYETDSTIYGDFWIYWYNLIGDTFVTVSGGNHSGCMRYERQNGVPVIISFEQTVDGAGNDASARRIFGSHYDVYVNVHSSERVREAVRQEQLREYIQRHGLNIRYYKDYGWPAVEL